jgi:hypothetical protein
MRPMLAKVFNQALIAILIVQLTGCGTLMYPERKGQKTGRIDMGVFLLDAVGLLFFLIPGIIAFVVDFNNGTIYLPGTQTTKLREIKFDPKTTTHAQIEQIIKNETGKTVKLNQSNMRVSRLHSKNEMMTYMAKAINEMEVAKIASAR